VKKQPGSVALLHAAQLVTLARAQFQPMEDALAPMRKEIAVFDGPAKADQHTIGS
jgi:hypothetical protein